MTIPPPSRRQLHCMPSRHSLKKTNKTKQECISVGCVPAARRPYSGVCFPGGYLPGLGGRGVVGGCGALPVWGGVCLVQGGLPGPGGVLPGLGGSPCQGVCLSRGGGVLPVKGGFFLPGDPPCGQNHRHL